jgi:uncharacterized membrane-anchored protein YjiN (DUF445 family)
MNKSILTNCVAAGLVATGLLIEGSAKAPVLNTGMFALAGGVTNWLAIHMLFEKVPGLYGSGVIVERFEDFKAGIHDLVMTQFFSKENLDRFFAEMVKEDADHQLDFSDIIEQTDLEPIYIGLVATIMESSFGSMLGMFGGESALEPLKEPFIVKMKQALNDLAHSDSFQQSVRDKLSSSSVENEIAEQIDQIVTARLNELTPEMVKDIIQTMIREHLGWLVVWGGVFGGLIGLTTSFLPI